jgi:protoporphyrinogen/coproporphyrinogen III oxidase
MEPIVAGMDEKRDVVVVGGGIGGLAAAWQLRGRDVVVLEAEDRLGGRMKSFPRDEYWLSVGAHMFAGPDSDLGRLVSEMDLRLLPIDGELFGISFGGRTLLGGRPEFFPLRLPMSLGGRVSFMRAGVKLRADARRFHRAARRREGESNTENRTRQLSFEGERSFSDYIGRLHPDAAAILNPISRRMTAEPYEISAGSVISLFAHVFAGDASLSFALDGGASLLTDAVGQRLGDSVRTSARVLEVSNAKDRVRVVYESGKQRHVIAASAAIVAVPAPHALPILIDAPSDVVEALGKIRYGPMVVGAMLTSEQAAMPWDDTYSVVAANKSFTMMFNHACALRKANQPRKPGGSLMVYGGGNLARALWKKSDDEIADTFAHDLYSILPDTRGIISETIVQRWQHTVPYAAPGRYRLQPILERSVGDRIFLAGDYVGDWVSMDSAATTGFEAAEKVMGVLRKAGSQRAVRA